MKKLKDELYLFHDYFRDIDRIYEQFEQFEREALTYSSSLVSDYSSFIPT